MCVLRLDEVWAGYREGAPVLQGCSLAVENGEIVALLGRNGVGKSTLLRAIVGLVRTSRGAVHLGDVDITRQPVHRRARLGIGYAPQGGGGVPYLAGGENLRVAVRGSAAEGRPAIDAGVEELPLLAG